jgi:adenine phosphoribosyltransferase
MDLKAVVRDIADYPQPGIVFRDITTLLGDAAAFAYALDQLAAPFVGAGVSKVAGVEARGFILGGAVADRLSAGFIPLRKKGKLPFHKHTADYDLEYGRDQIEMHLDAVEAGEKVLLIDDLIATGGTAIAACHLLRYGGAQIVGAAFIIELPDLGGAAALREEGVDVTTLIAFEGD